MSSAPVTQSAALNRPGRQMKYVNCLTNTVQVRIFCQTVLAFSEATPSVSQGLRAAARKAKSRGYIREVRTCTAKVTLLADAHEFLDVCVNSVDGSNCSHCEKCPRTLLTLEILGNLDDFASRFDLDRYWLECNTLAEF